LRDLGLQQGPGGSAVHAQLAARAWMPWVPSWIMLSRLSRQCCSTA
jgi:hypothetical protein